MFDIDKIRKIVEYIRDNSVPFLVGVLFTCSVTYAAYPHIIKSGVPQSDKVEITCDDFNGDWQYINSKTGYSEKWTLSQDKDCSVTGFMDAAHPVMTGKVNQRNILELTVEKYTGKCLQLLAFEAQLISSDLQFKRSHKGVKGECEGSYLKPGMILEPIEYQKIRS